MSFIFVTLTLLLEIETMASFKIKITKEVAF